MKSIVITLSQVTDECATERMLKMIEYLMKIWTIVWCFCFFLTLIVYLLHVSKFNVYVYMVCQVTLPSLSVLFLVLWDFLPCRLSCGDCLGDKRAYYQNCSVL